MSEHEEELAGEAPEAATPGASHGGALAASIAVGQARADPKVAKETIAFLQKQGRMLDLQMEHLAEQRVAILKDLQLRVLGQRMRLGLQLFTTLFATVIGLGLLVLVRGALESRSVVVEAFDSPPVMAARGYTGRVVAGGVLDALTRLQAATRSAAVKRNLQNAWTGDIKVEVPETGISIGEIDRLLHERLGRDVHIDGELVQTETGLALSVRGDSVLPRTFSGGPGDLDKLTTQAAEYVYGQSEPVLYAAYLNTAGRYAEEEAFLQEAFPRASEADRPDLANLWANDLASEGRDQEADEKYRLAVQLDPLFWKAWANLIGSANVTKGQETAYRVSHQMLAAAAGAPSNRKTSPLNRVNWDGLSQDWQAVYDDNMNDVKTNGAVGTQLQSSGPIFADASARMHDWASAERYLTQSDPKDSYTQAERSFAAGLHALEAGQVTAAVTALQVMDTRWRSDANLQYDYFDYPCYLGLAYGLAGRLSEAVAVFDRLPLQLSCAAFRADAIDASGDWPAAQAAYARAVASGPDLPLPYQRWGLALLRRGDGAGAAAKFRQASQSGPHWADALKGWGDALAAQGRWPDAVEKYAAAARYAPHWSALHLAWAQALDRLGQRAEAHRQYQAVTGI